MEPASLTKLMTAYIVFQELAAGKLKLEEPVMVSEKAWRSGDPYLHRIGQTRFGRAVDLGNDRAVRQRCNHCPG